MGFTTLLTSQVISVAFYSEREKSDKFCSEALISVWGSFTCRKSTTRDPWLYSPSEGSHTQDFYTLRESINLRTSDPVASMRTTKPPGPTLDIWQCWKQMHSKYMLNSPPLLWNSDRYGTLYQVPDCVKSDVWNSDGFGILFSGF